MLSDRQLLDAAKEKKRKRIADAEAEFDREVSAIEIVRRLREQSDPPSNGDTRTTPHSEKIATESSTNRMYVNEEWPGLPQILRRAVAALKDKPFTLEDIIAWITPRFPDRVPERIELSRGLWRLKQTNEVEVIRPGLGRKPAVYKTVPAKDGE